MTNHRVTILDVAKDAGVSPATVSRVLRDSARVDPKLKQRVLQAVYSLDYQPNANAQSLKTLHTYEIGFLVSDISNSYYSSIARSIENIVSPKNYNLILCSHDESSEREKAYLMMLQRRNVEALIVNPTCSNNELIADVSRFIPTIAMNRHIDNTNFHGNTIDTDGYTACKTLTVILLREGHRKIFCVRGPNHFPNANDRFAGFVDAMAEYGVTVDENYPYVYNGLFTKEGGVCAVEQMRSYKELPTAIFSQSNMMTIGILEQLRQYNIMIPEDLSFVCHDQLDNMNLFKYRLTCAGYDLDAIADKVGSMILQKIENNDTELPDCIFPPTIDCGNTVAPPTNSLREKLFRKL